MTVRTTCKLAAEAAVRLVHVRTRGSAELGDLFSERTQSPTKYHYLTLFLRRILLQELGHGLFQVLLLFFGLGLGIDGFACDTAPDQ